jgi:hypothetical protein
VIIIRLGERKLPFFVVVQDGGDDVYLFVDARMNIPEEKDFKNNEKRQARQRGIEDVP